MTRTGAYTVVAIFSVLLSFGCQESDLEKKKEKNAALAAEISKLSKPNSGGKYALTEDQVFDLQVAQKEALLAKYRLDSLAEEIRKKNKFPATVAFDEMGLQFIDPPLPAPTSAPKP